MAKENIYLGKEGEKLALGLLKKEGYRILIRNYRSRLGEIDIVAQDKNTICFIEVKTRQALGAGGPLESINALKQRKISKTALGYLKDKHLLDIKARFDVVAVTYDENKPRLDLIKNAFELDAGYTY